MGLSRPRAAAFAAGCATVLLPSYEWFTRAGGRGDMKTVRSGIDDAWLLSSDTGEINPDVSKRREQLLMLLPDDSDPDWVLMSPIAQNAVASVVYALNVLGAGDQNDPVWAARQVFEAADFIIQIQAGPLQYVDETSNVPVMRIALAGIEAALAGAQVGRDMPQMRAHSEFVGAQIAALLPATVEGY
nr:DUF416 family protein [Agreia sp. COWG]